MTTGPISVVRQAWQAGRHLFSTLHVTADATEGLFVHPNTVRYRLRRVEELRGRSLTDPMTVALREPT